MAKPYSKEDQIGVKKSKEKKAKVKQYVCHHCKRKYTRLISKSMVKWCSPECGYQLSLKAKKKKQDQIARKDRIRIKKEKEKLKSVSQIGKELTVLLQKLARIIDENQPCICTGEIHRAYDGGHFWSVGAFPNLKYHMDNIHKCSVLSNQWRSGDENRYRHGLKRRYGDDYFEYVDSLPRLYPTLKPDKESLKSIKIEMRAIIRNWDNQKYTRDELNEIIGLYQ